MLVTTGTFSGYGLGLAGDAAVERLQRSLKNLAQATGRPNIDPGTIDGIIGPQTIGAVSASFSMISEHLPKEAAVPLQAALLAASFAPDQAKKYVTQYAAPLAVACDAAAVKFRQTPTPGTTIMPSASTPWYKTPIGIGALVIGAFVLYKFVLAPSPKKAA